MIKIKFKENENIRLFFILTVVSVIICFNFILPHTVPDTYNIFVNKRYESATFLGDGRLLTGIIVYIFGNISEIIPTLMVLLSIIGVICLNYSVYILYNTIVDKSSKKIVKLIVLIGSYLVIFNPFAMEHFAYFESGIIMFGKMLCVISAKKLIVDGKRINSLLIALLAGICYQGIMNVFITIAILLILIQKNKGIKEKLKDILWTGIISLIVLISIVITVKTFNVLLERVDTRIISSFKNRNYLYLLMKLIIISIFKTSNLFSEYFISIVIIISVILFSFLFNFKEVFKYLLIVLISFLTCTVPLLLQENISIETRTITSIGSIIGISIILLGKNLKQNDKKYKENIILMFSIILFAINSFYYIKDGIILNISNRCEKQYMNEIVDIIKEYEEQEDTKITKVAFYHDKNPQKTFKNFPDNTFSIKGVYTIYGRENTLEYYLNEPIQEVEKTQNYIDYFAVKDWTSLSKEQFIFEDDTLHLCTY